MPRKLPLQFVMICIITLVLLGCTPAAETEAPEPVAESPELQLATASVRADFDTAANRVQVTGHNNTQYFVAKGPEADSLQVVDTLLAAQTTCGVFVAEKAAQELDITLEGASATSVFDPINQQVEVYLDLPGANEEDVLSLANNFRQRCPIYTTLSEAKSVNFAAGEQMAAVPDDATVVTATLFEFGKANVTVGDNTFVIDSVPPLDGPNIELNPLDMMLGGLAACSTFIEQEVTSGDDAAVVVEADFDPTGVRDLDGPNPRIRNMRILLQGASYGEAEITQIDERIQSECELYSMLSGTVNIEIVRPS